MKQLVTLIANLGQYLASLSDKTRLRVVLIGLLLLGGPAAYKLVVNLKNLTEAVPSASTDAFIQPMQQLIRQTSSQADAYQRARQQSGQQLDSLKIYYQSKSSR